MPTYAYRCQCGHYDERFIRMSEYTPTRDCEKCNTAAGLKQTPVVPQQPIFKGTGYYVTDFKHK